MDKELDKVRKGFERMFSQPGAMLSGAALSVDEDKFTCSVQVGPIKINDVRLKASAGTSNYGFVLIPENNAYILCARIGDDLVMVSCDKVKKVLLKIEDMTLEVTSSGFVFNGGNLKGMVKIDDLVSKLNEHESKINDLVTFSASHVHPGVTTGSGSTAVTVTPVVGALPTTLASDLENTKVKH